MIRETVARTEEKVLDIDVAVKQLHTRIDRVNSRMWFIIGLILGHMVVEAFSR